MVILQRTLCWTWFLLCSAYPNVFGRIGGDTIVYDCTISECCSAQVSPEVCEWVISQLGKKRDPLAPVRRRDFWLLSCSHHTGQVPPWVAACRLYIRGNHSSMYLVNKILKQYSAAFITCDLWCKSPWQENVYTFLIWDRRRTACNRGVSCHEQPLLACPGSLHLRGALGLFSMLAVRSVTGVCRSQTPHAAVTQAHSFMTHQRNRTMPPTQRGYGWKESKHDINAKPSLFCKYQQHKSSTLLKNPIYICARSEGSSRGHGQPDLLPDTSPGDSTSSRSSSFPTAPILPGSGGGERRRWALWGLRPAGARRRPPRLRRPQGGPEPGAASAGPSGPRWEGSRPGWGRPTGPGRVLPGAGLPFGHALVFSSTCRLLGKAARVRRGGFMQGSAHPACWNSREMRAAAAAGLGGEGGCLSLPGTRAGAVGLGFQSAGCRVVKILKI